MSPKVLVVFGATGFQGGAIINHLLSFSPNSYTIRAATRNPSSTAAQKLAASGIQVVHADLDDPSSLASALTGAHAVFLVTDFFSCADPGAEHEKTQAKRALSILATSPTLEHLIYSSLPSIHKASGGKYTAVVHFDGKAEVVQWLSQTHKELWAKMTVLWVGTYMQLWTQFRDVFAPRKTANQDGNEVWVQKLAFYPETRLPLADVQDVGKTVHAVLVKGETLKGGKTVSIVAPDQVSVQEQLGIWGRHVGREVAFIPLNEEESLKAVESLGFPEYLTRDILEVILAYRDCEGRLLHQKGVIQASEILLGGEKLTTWREFVIKEDWKGLLEG